MRRYRVPLGMVVFFLIVRAIAGMNAFDSAAVDAAEPSPYVQDEMLCRFRPETTELEKSGARAELVATRSHQFLSGAELWKLPSGRSVQSAIELMSTKESVVYAEPNYYGEFTQSQCADTYCPAEWHLTRIAATGSPAAWQYSTGSRNVVVAIPDSGGDFNHADFGPNIWYNPGEVSGNGFDDDGNGYIDDVRGWDFGSVDNDPTALHFHGVSIAGVVGAIMGAASGFTTGVVGISPQVSLMTLKINVSAESPTVAKAAQAIDYAAFQGRAHIINVSFVFSCPNPATCHQTLKDSIKIAGDREILVVAAAGNDDRNVDLPNQGLAPVSDLPSIK